MPYTKLQSQIQEKARKKYVTVKDFQNQYSLSRAQAYKILARDEMKDAVIKTGEKSIRVDLDLAFSIMQQIY